MAELWYAIIVLSLAAYVVLDGYDLGAGALHLWVARDDRERREVLAAIGPYWDANEVWLLAAGGALLVAFPRAMSAGLSGFYLAVFLILWCLIGRGVSIEVRSHVEQPLWRTFWDTMFCVSSALLPVFFGVALANLVRGVPLTADGWFQLTLFTHFAPREPVGLLDWYTVLVGVFALVALTAHGATFLAWRTGGGVHERSRVAARVLYGAVVALWIACTVATVAVRPGLLATLSQRPLALAAAALALGGLVTVFVATARGRALHAFLGSSTFLAGMLVATAACLFPALVPSLPGSGPPITAYDGGATERGLTTALGWWVAGFPLVLGYFFVTYRLHRGKVRLDMEDPA
ncbi:MAG: cytochrome d ubiquinol oxidase subunit II [Candidatus Eisenbacteria bacterium]